MKITKHKTKTLKRLLKVPDADLDVFFSYYMGEIEVEQMSSDQQEKLVRYIKAWSWYSLGRTRQMIVDGLMKDHDIQKRQAEYDFAASVAIHGKKDQVDKDGRRAASIEYLDLLSQLAMKEKRFDWAQSCRKEADLLMGIYDTEADGFDPEDFVKPSKIVFVTKVDVHNYGKEKILDLDE
jgi:hypothetical protein